MRFCFYFYQPQQKHGVGGEKLIKTFWRSISTAIFEIENCKHNDFTNYEGKTGIHLA